MGEIIPTVRDLLTMTPEQLNRAEWRAVAHTLREAQKTMEAGCPTGRYSWMDSAVHIATDNGREPDDG